MVSILPANEDDAFTNVVLAVDIDAAKEELFVVIALDKVSIFSAAEELFVVTVVDNEFMVDTKDEDPREYEELSELKLNAMDELNVVSVP